MGSKKCCGNGGCSSGNKKKEACCSDSSSFIKKCKSKCMSKKHCGLFLIRLGLALVFFIHGILKFTQFDQTATFFMQNGLPEWSVYLAGIFEIVLGLAMLLGVWTCVAGMLIAVYMFIIIILYYVV